MTQSLQHGDKLHNSQDSEIIAFLFLNIYFTLVLTGRSNGYLEEKNPTLLELRKCHHMHQRSNEIIRHITSLDLRRKLTSSQISRPNNNKLNANYQSPNSDQTKKKPEIHVVVPENAQLTLLITKEQIDVIAVLLALSKLVVRKVGVQKDKGYDSWN